MKNLSLKYLVREPKIKVDKAPLIILLHGYGSNEEDLFSFAEELPDSMLVISVRAPLSLGFESYAWYTIHFETNDADKFSDIPEAKQALQKIGIFIEQIIKEYDVDQDNVFLFGFSQGTILSIAYALNNPDKIHHVIALSGYVNVELLNKDVGISNFHKLDFFVSHGSVDQVIPVIWARKTPGFLDNLGIENSYQEYPVGHGVAPQNFHDLNNWIKDRI
jgi:phospholipase/carboxylesterase